MSNDDSRGNESPDRKDESQHQITDYRPILEHLDTKITDLLETITDDETLEPRTRLRAKRHCRELWAELELLECDLLETEEWRAPRETDPTDGTESLTGSIEVALEQVQWGDNGGHSDETQTDEVEESDD
ncbi:hypothetical protein [Natrinema halophilum]|uniref:Uncharacterized protein n=1 Tax=Natrinema halophilum TaxID=1699371 RepID=A0A7D5GHA0_9EURY|nr:hypothetical protein [Natrinema halophilum]QLG48908.1 hypothetical protein HYG82_08610 [Natrinema halophilum]